MQIFKKKPQTHIFSTLFFTTKLQSQSIMTISAKAELYMGISRDSVDTGLFEH